MAYYPPFLAHEWRRLSPYCERSKKKSNGAGILSGYGITDEYASDMDSDDGEGSRGIPSRTRIGKKASVIEKFPILGEPLVLFGGLITIPFWGYRSLSIAYTDVMVADLPHVLYNTKERITDEDVQKANELHKQLQERKKNGVGLGLGSRFNLNNDVDASTYVQQHAK